jgi:hypothetical protein
LPAGRQAGVKALKKRKAFQKIILSTSWLHNFLVSPKAQELRQLVKKLFNFLLA